MVKIKKEEETQIDVEENIQAEVDEITPSEIVEPIEKPVSMPELKIEPKIKVAKGPETVRVKFKKSIGPFFYGEDFFRFKSGETKAVPKGMVSILLGRDAIDVLP